jgi:hypothetical protein
MAVQRDPLAAQERLVRRLMPRLGSTVRGRELSLSHIRDYTTYLSSVPTTAYGDYQRYIERLASGEKSVLCGGAVQAMVQTSGTTGYLNKHIPYDEAMLQASARYQYRVAATMAVHCKGVDPLFDDRMSYATVVRNTTRMVGSIPKANASELWSVSKVPLLGKGRQILTTQVLDAPDWETKLRQIEHASRDKDVRIVTGIPLYLVGIFEHLLKARGLKQLKECYPNLRAVFYSGSHLGSYRERLNALAGRGLKYFGGYLASEGLFGLPTPEGSSVLFNVDDFLFAFRPSQGLHHARGVRLLGLHELEIGGEYEIFVGCPNGLLNYAVGDVVRIDSLKPFVTFSVLGRNLSINVANEKTSQARIELVARLCEAKLGQPIEHYFVHPSEGPDGLPSYVWTLICNEPEALSTKELEQTLDDLLIEQAPDYADCRVNDGLIGPVKVQIVPTRARLHDHLLAINQGKGQYKMKSVYRSAEEFSQALAPAAARSGIELML